MFVRWNDIEFFAILRSESEIASLAMPESHQEFESSWLLIVPSGSFATYGSYVVLSIYCLQKIYSTLH